jgi:ribonuclease HI
MFGEVSIRYGAYFPDPGGSSAIAVALSEDTGTAYPLTSAPDIMVSVSGDADDVVRLERLLLDPAVRADAGAVDRLLHPDFVEFGASGRVWDRTSMIAALAADSAVSGAAADFRTSRVADDVVLLTYRSSERTLRSSLWVRDGEAGWRLRFHQGTRVPPS